MKKLLSPSSIFGGQTHGALSASAFGAGAMWLLLCEKQAGCMPKTGVNIRNNSFPIVGSLLICAAIPSLADSFCAIDNYVIDTISSFFLGASSED